MIAKALLYWVLNPFGGSVLKLRIYYCLELNAKKKKKNPTETHNSWGRFLLKVLQMRNWGLGKERNTPNSQSYTVYVVEGGLSPGLLYTAGIWDDSNRDRRGEDSEFGKQGSQSTWAFWARIWASPSSFLSGGWIFWVIKSSLTVSSRRTELCGIFSTVIAPAACWCFCFYHPLYLALNSLRLSRAGISSGKYPKLCAHRRN